MGDAGPEELAGTPITANPFFKKTKKQRPYVAVQGFQFNVKTLVQKWMFSQIFLVRLLRWRRDKQTREKPSFAASNEWIELPTEEASRLRAELERLKQGRPK